MLSTLGPECAIIYIAINTNRGGKGGGAEMESRGEGGGVARENILANYKGNAENGI